MSRKPAQDFLLFLIGGSLFAAGIVLFTNQVMVATGNHASLWGFGMGRFGGGILGGGVGCFLVWASAAAIGVLVLQSLIFSFRPASLQSLLSMVIMVAGGGGLMFRSLREYPEEERTQSRKSSAETRQSLKEVREDLERLRSRFDRDAP